MIFMKNPVETAQAAISALDKRRALLQSRLGSAVVGAQQSARDAIDYLVVGDDDPARARELEEAAREQRRVADQIALALTEIDQRIEDAERNLRGARDQEARESRAAELDAAAAAISKRAVALERAVDALATAFNSFVVELPEDFSVERERLFPNDQRLSEVGNGTDAARAILAGALYLSEPRLFEVSPVEQSYAPAHCARAIMLRHFDEKAGGKLDHRLWGATGEEVDIASVRASTEKHIVSPLLAMARALRSPRSAAA